MTSFDPSELLLVGEDLRDLAGNPAPEPFRRSIANRSYYAAYGVVRRAIESLRSDAFAKSGRHARLVEVLSASKDPHVARIGTRLNRLKAFREHADYEFDHEFPQDHAEQSLAVAKKALDRMATLSPPQISIITEVFAQSR